jgi:peroxiredoxin
MRKFIYLAIAALLFSLTTTIHASQVEGPAPDFTLKSITGENLKLSEYRGEVVMINFWASWCAPCRQEMPLLDSLYQKYKDLGFTLLGINLDEKSAQAEKLLKEIPVNFPILLDPKSEISRLYKVSAMPTTILVDRDGNMRFLHKGYMPGYEEDYEKQIKTLVME